LLAASDGRQFKFPFRPKSLRPGNIRRIGIVAIGRVFDADAAVSAVSYY